MRSFTQRMVAAARLDPTVYNEVEHDPQATGQAVGVVAIVAVASALGGFGSPAATVVGGLIWAIVVWFVYAGIAYLVGDKILGGTASWGELLRTLGFAQSPGVLYFVAALPFIGWVARTAVWVWILVAGIIAIREALDFSTAKAILTAFIGWVFFGVLGALLLAAVSL